MEATAPEFETFAREIQKRIDSRLYGGKNTPMHKLVGWTRTRKDGTVIHTDAIRTSQPEDDDFLDTLRQDPHVFGGGMETIQGYEVHTGATKVVDE